MTNQTHDLAMPAFGADMATGTLIEWQVKEGDSVKRGDVVAVIETNKGAIELDIFEDTVIEEILVQVGDEVKVGSVIAKLRGAAAGMETESENEVQQPVQQKLAVEEKAESTNQSQFITSAEDSSFVLASPAARYQAKQNNIKLSDIASNLKRPITLKDLPVRDVVESGMKDKSDNQMAAPGQLMRDAISDTVTLSKQTIPHYYLNHRLDITELQSYVSNYNRDKEPEERVLLAAPLLTAVARLLAKHTSLNGQFVDGQFKPSKEVHLAHAVNIRGVGLMMPVIRDASSYNAVSMMQKITEQVSQARRGRLPLSQLTGATCCVSSIGERGAEQMSAIIQPPQVAIVSLGSPHQQPLVIEGDIKVRNVIISGLAADHRVSDGHVGAKFLYQLNKLLQEPEKLWTDKN